MAIAGIRYLWLRPVDTRPLTLGVSVAALCLLVTSSGTVFMNLEGRGQIVDAQAVEEQPPAALPVLPVAVERSALPDIYYIVLDGYPRSDSLAHYFDFDNSSFPQALRERGFYIADASHSNYTMTFLSIASSLNMRYVTREIVALRRMKLRG